MRDIQEEGFFLSDEQVDKMPKFSVDLYDAAADLLAQRGDFTLEELLNFAFSITYKKQLAWRNGG